MKLSLNIYMLLHPCSYHTLLYSEMSVYRERSDKPWFEEYFNSSEVGSIYLLNDSHINYTQQV